MSGNHIIQFCELFQNTFLLAPMPLLQGSSYRKLLVSAMDRPRQYVKIPGKSYEITIAQVRSASLNRAADEPPGVACDVCLCSLDPLTGDCPSSIGINCTLLLMCCYSVGAASLILLQLKEVPSKYRRAWFFPIHFCKHGRLEPFRDKT